MSKNVAVFVDVANIFYAAKAAGVDIDYVTLLKSATAGRDFVRAYAYTGLDPENENQRQFHAFLGRSGYKVVSKDIRKYGDGRIKANLDIELVVDMMRMGEKLDIAVVISGDGDFAPAIVAVQQMGVRVEVISFRGNTSSDLIDVADAFIDITSVAKVEKGVRSGRRVATDGDLSMTEVPDKESGVAPRRRRRRDEDEKAEAPETAIRPARRVRTTRPAEPAPSTPIAASGAVGALVALPGEKLSRRADVAVEPEAYVMPDAFAGSDELAGVEAPAGVQALDRPFGDQPADDGSGRRRRRRRGGRGRGRGGRADEPGVVELGAEGLEDDEAVSGSEPTERPVEFAEYDDEVPTLPQLSGFGSVWDSQIASPSRKAIDSTPPGPLEGEDLDGEPEIPEYLLAERRQQGRRPARGARPGGGGRQGGGYRSAIDRERYGSGPRSGAAAQGRGDQGNRLSSPSPARRRSSMSMEPIEQTRGGDQWSEVPPEVQALLKAELARRGATSNNRPIRPSSDEAAKKASGGKPSATASQAEAAVTEAAPKKPASRKPSAKASQAEAAVTEAAPKKPARRKPSARASQAETSSDIEAAPKKPSRRKPSAKANTADTGAEVEASEA